MPWASIAISTVLIAGCSSSHEQAGKTESDEAAQKTVTAADGAEKTKSPEAPDLFAGHPRSGLPVMQPQVLDLPPDDAPAILPGLGIEEPTAKTPADSQMSAAEPKSGPGDEPPARLTADSPLRLASEEGEEKVNPLRDPNAKTGDRVPAPPSKPEAAKEPPVPVKEPLAPVKPKRKKHSDVPFDPIKENGPIFVGWPKPKLALLITGRMDGYMEPCGCAGLDRMKGGLGRRHTLFKNLRQQGWPVVGIDVGGLAKGFGKQPELKFQNTVEAMRRMGYSTVALGASDLRLPAGVLVAETADAGTQKGMFISANVGLLGFASGFTPKMRIIEAGGHKLGITAVVGKGYKDLVQSDEVEFADPAAALKRVVPELKKKADYLILLAHADMKETLELAKAFPEFNLVVTAGGGAEPPAKAMPINGTKGLLVEVGEKGMNAVVLGLFDDAKEPVRYQRVPLDSRFAGSTDIRRIMTNYQEQLKELRFQGLGIRAVPHPLKEIGGNYIGSKKCDTCHEESGRVWRRSPHSKAYETLAKLDPPRTHDPECISCHVVGWHPTKYFPYEGGFQSLEKTPELTDAGCENCHGPGEKHALAEQGTDKVLQKKLQEASRITKAESASPLSKKANCFTCHDGDNSPDFDFDTYWPDVEHYEKGE
jgi:hypothetical protein